MKPLLVVIGGPTGIGKTPVSIALAQHFKTEIVSADSRQFFKEMTIGTAVPSPSDLAKVKHHLVQNLSIDEAYNASRYESDALACLDGIFKQNNIAFLVGGSGLYIDAICKGIDDLPSISAEVRQKLNCFFEIEGLERLQEEVNRIDPEYFEVVDKNNPKRLLKALEVFEMTGLPYSRFLLRTSKERSFHVINLFLDTNRTVLYNRINQRVDKMVQAGLVEEARSLWPKKGLTPLKTVGYSELFSYFEGNLKLEEAIEQIKNHSRAYARRQLTWFRRYSESHWFDPVQLEEVKALIQSNIEFRN
ncbi:MAG: tRNA (adenosine(37)-N6)-dimethylallyltransferase MiaA [Bacteroidota bacterium]|nr:MAG: tRNA (adenosine(37)-N6)-dimethylallyltransferase MiaA [Bacteroidota bacterium]